MKHTLRISKWLMLLSFAVTLVLWLGFGGRAEFVASDGPYSAVVYVSGWLALLGLASATVLSMGFFGGLIANTAKRVAIQQSRATRR